MLCAPTALWAAATAEEIAYNAASRFFDGALYQQADKEFGEFTKLFPTSERISEAVLHQAKARHYLKQYDGVISLLSTNMPRAGKLADQYRNWMAKASFDKANYPGAVALYAQLLKDYPESLLRFDASYGEALAWFQMGNLTNTIERLRQPGGAFQKAAQAQPNEESVLRGYLLLGEALLKQKEFRPAEETLNLLVNRQLPPQLDWKRQYLVAEVQMADHRPEAALKGITNLVAAATATASEDLKAETILLHAEILEAMNQPTNAIQIYEQNLEKLPVSQRRQALLKTAELYLKLGNSAKTVERLDGYLKQYPDGPNLDQVRLLLGDLRLKEYYALRRSASGTNLQATLQAATLALQLAQTNFDLLITNSPQSPLAGQAYLNRGWCLWEGGKIAESQLAFKTAAERLPVSTNQATARFKWADAQFELKDYTNAILNYRYVVEHYATLPGMASNLVERTLYQILRTSVELHDLSGATQAAEKLLEQFPKSEFGDASLLAVGQMLSHLGKTAEARTKYADLLKRFPGSTLVSEAVLAVARSYVLESNWDGALTNYDAWIARFTNHAALPEVEFNRAWTAYQAGRESVALQLFTNFVVRFPKHPWAPLAQNWVGIYYENLGQYPEAQRNYQRVYENTNWPPSELTYRAQLSAARAAFARQGYNDAEGCLTSLINQLNGDTNAAPTLLSEAWFALGDTIFTGTRAASANLTNSLARLGEAVTALKKIPESEALLWPLAQGRIADCYLQLAGQDKDTNRYRHAANAYQAVIASQQANIAARSQAEVGLGVVFERMAADPNRTPAEKAALLATALEHYASVLEQANLHPAEPPDTFWFVRAGQDAARLLEAQGKWEPVVKIYEDLIKAVPNLRLTLQKRLDEAKKRL